MPEILDTVNTHKAPTTGDIAPWFKAHLGEIDSNHNRSIEPEELFESIGANKYDLRDSAIVLSMLSGFELFDLQDKADGQISLQDVEAMSSRSKDPSSSRTEMTDKFLAAKFDGLKEMIPALWGQFKNPLDAINPDAVRQGGIGDCWFLGSVAAVAQTMPEVILKMISPLPSGQFRVTFPGAPAFPVIVEAPTPIEMAVFAGGGKHGSWVAVLEKAAAKLWNQKSPYPDKHEIYSLNGGDGGVALQLLTGAPYSRLDPQDINFRQKLGVCEQWAIPVVCGSAIAGTDQIADERGVYFCHIYTVTFDSREGLVTVRNPWGWKPGSSSEPTNKDGSPKDGKADGAFKLSIADFRKSFPVVWAAVP